MSISASKYVFNYLISYHTTLFKTHVVKTHIVANMTNNNQGFTLFQTIRSLWVIKTKGIKKLFALGQH